MKVKVYIGWSGEISQKIALILKAWLPLMYDYIETFVSMDVPGGVHWLTKLRDMLSSADCALLCFTKDNINSPWLHYEAGAMISSQLVTPILFDVSPSQFTTPLRALQVITLTKDSMQTREDMRVLTHKLNALCRERGYGLPSELLDTRFEAVYPTIEKMLAEVRKLQETREREEYEREKRAWGELPRMSGENLQQDFQTLNSKLDAILSQLSKVSSGNVDGKAE